MKYKRIQYFIIYILLISCLFFSKDQLVPGNNLWIFLFNNYNETNIVVFVIINLFYLFILYLYIPSKKSLFKILHLIFNKLHYFKLVLFLLDIYYFLYLKYFRIKQYFIIKIHLYIISTPNLLNTYYIKGCLYLSTFDHQIFIPEDFKTNKEKQFYLNLYKNFYLIPIYIKLNNHIYRLTLLEFITLIEKHTDISNKRKSILQFLSRSKTLNKFVRLICFWIQIEYLYSDLRYADFRSGIKFYIKYLFYMPLINYKVKPTAYLIKLFNKDPRLIRQFIILLLHKYLKLLKKKKNIFDLDTLSDKKRFILNNNNNQFKSLELLAYNNHFNKIEFNLFYLYFKTIDNFKNLYKSIIISNFFKEFKIMYQLIKFLFLFYILSFFILKNLLNIVVPIYFLSIFFLRLFYTYNIIGSINYWSNKRLMNHTLFRIIYYYSIYYLNFYFFFLDNFYFILINYLINTFIFIIIISLYDIHSNFFYIKYPLIKLEGLHLNKAISIKIRELINNWITKNQSNYFSKIYIAYYTFINKERTIYSKSLDKEYLKKKNET